MTDSTNPTTITAPAGVPFIDTAREFDAPVAAVFRAYTDQELVVQWMGPRGYDIEITEWQQVTGGRYAYTHRDESNTGEGYSFRGVIHELVEDHHITRTFEFAGAPGQVSLETATFIDLGGQRTRVEGHSVFSSQEGRDGIIASGMERGVVEGFERLDVVLGAGE